MWFIFSPKIKFPWDNLPPTPSLLLPFLDLCRLCSSLAAPWAGWKHVQQVFKAPSLAQLHSVPSHMGLGSPHWPKVGLGVTHSYGLPCPLLWLHGPAARCCPLWQYHSHVAYATDQEHFTTQALNLAPLPQLPPNYLRFTNTARLIILPALCMKIQQIQKVTQEVRGVRRSSAKAVLCVMLERQQFAPSFYCFLLRWPMSPCNLESELWAEEPRWNRHSCSTQSLENCWLY